MQTRRWRRIQCFGAAAVCLFLFLTWGKTYFDSGNREAGRLTESRTTIGLPFSPWYEYVIRTEQKELPNGGFRSSQTARGQVVWASWSWLLAAGFVVFWELARRLKPNEPEAEASREHRDQAGAPQADLRDPR